MGLSGATKVTGQVFVKSGIRPLQQKAQCAPGLHAADARQDDACGVVIHRVGRFQDAVSGLCARIASAVQHSVHRGQTDTHSGRNVLHGGAG